MNANYISKKQLVQFIADHSDMLPATRNTRTQLGRDPTLFELYGQLLAMRSDREYELTTLNIHHREWVDDDIMGEIQEYMDYIEPAISDEEQNIQLAAMTSFVGRRTRIPTDVTRYIQEFVVQSPKHKRPDFKRLGGGRRISVRKRSRRKRSRRKRSRRKRSRRKRSR